MLLLAALLFIFSVSAKKGKGYGHGNNFDHSHHHHEDSHDCDSDGPQQQQVQLAVGQVYDFDFGAAGTFALQNFIYYGVQETILQVWDCFCGGDRFAVFDNGQWIASADEGCADAVANCNPYSSEPWVCLEQQGGIDGWCRIPNGGVRLGTGPHNITIQVLVNYYRTGKGFLSLEYYYNTK